MSRTRNSLNNFKWALIGQSLGIVVSFVARIFFIRKLGNDYLGLNGLFTNILTILTLAELGVGDAINYSLYKPLADKDLKKCKMLMNLYKKLYTIIGIVILILGLCITPFLSFIIKDMPNVPNISLIFMLFVVNTAISYFYSYKRNLLIADQNRYIATIYRYGIYIITNVVQIFYLLITSNYIGFLVIQIIFTLIENILVSKHADKMYPYLKEESDIPLDKKTKDSIVKNTKALVMHKIGGVVVNSTDNIIISKFVNLVAVGLYSNYYMVTNALMLVINQVYSSILASVGNLCNKKDKNYQYAVFKNMEFMTFWIATFTSVSLLCLIDDFIKIWVGKEYLLSNITVIVIVLNFYISISRKAVLTFRDATGVFYKDRYKALVEALINIVASLILVLKYQITGVFIGTVISSILACICVEPYVLYKYGFKRSAKSYYKNYLKKCMISLIIVVITYGICSMFSLNIYLNFILKAMICLIVPNMIILLIYRNSEEIKFFYKRIWHLIPRKEVKHEKF